MLATVGTYSGPAGATLVPMAQGAQLWVKDVNQRGGVNGHQVSLLVFDDGGDSARHHALIREAVERRNTFAFLINGDVLTGKPEAAAYLTAKGVPVVGVDGGQDYWYSSPVYFPHVSAGHYLVLTTAYSTGQQAVAKGLKKLGTLVCVESPTCDDFERTFGELAGQMGLDYVYRGKVSLAQPDFTAECLAARNQGVEVLFFSNDQNSSTRLSVACERQGYRPLLSRPGQVLADRKDDPALGGTIATLGTFPWFQSGTPATDEYQAAKRRLGDTIPPGAGPPMGWAAGKLFEKAAESLPEPPTREALFAGLWSMKNETLGGLVAPLTFHEHRPPAPMTCWFEIEMDVQHRVWRSPDGFKVHCH